MRRCVKCVLPEVCPGIAFDSGGICNVCHDFEARWGGFGRKVSSRKKELEGILDSYRDKSGKYDCLVPLSGGLDSTYVLYVCQEVYGLRTLAFNFNNGFQSEIAKQNMENAVGKLDVDFVTLGPAWERARRLYALFFRKTGEFCTPCNVGIWSMSFKVARDYGISLVVSGSSDRISERLPRGSRIYRWSPSYFREVVRGEMPVEDVRDFLCLPGDFHDRMLRSASERFVPSGGVDVLPLYDYVDYDVGSMLKTVEGELGWRRDGGRFHHIDCVMESVNDYFKQRRWGFSAAAWYSMLVRIGQVSRGEALESTAKEEERNSHEPRELELWLKLLGLSREDLEGFEKRSQSLYFPLQERHV
jgi:N-acetyl sugar amidotransferase